MLTCDYDTDYEPGMTLWRIPRGWSRHTRKRIPKCCSCGEAVPADKDCLEFDRFKVPEFDIEVKIYGEDGEIPRASWFMCWECGWRYLALNQHGYAIYITDNMRKLMIEHDELVAVGADGCA